MQRTIPILHSGSTSWAKAIQMTITRTTPTQPYASAHMCTLARRLYMGITAMQEIASEHLIVFVQW